MPPHGSSVRQHIAWKRDARACLRVMAPDMALEPYSAIDLRHSAYLANLRRAVGGILDLQPIGRQLQDRAHATYRSAQPCSHLGVFDIFLHRRGGPTEVGSQFLERSLWEVDSATASEAHSRRCTGALMCVRASRLAKGRFGETDTYYDGEPFPLL